VNNQSRVLFAMGGITFGLVLAMMFGMPRPKKRPFVSPYRPNASPPPVAISPDEPKLIAPKPLINAPKNVTHHRAKTSVMVYKLLMTEDATSLTPTMVELAENFDTPEKQAAAAIDALAKISDSPLPKDTHALSVKIIDSIATVNLSREFKQNFTGGDLTESLALNALTATVGQFGGTQRVQILVDGKKIDSLGGHASLTEPIPVHKEN
jgi:spore germination protein GerM